MSSHTRQPTVDDEFDMSEFCKYKISDIIDESLKKTIPDNSEIEFILDTSINLLNKLSIVLYKVSPCFPEHYQIFKMYKDTYLVYIYAKLKPFLNEESLKANKRI